MFQVEIMVDPDPSGLQEQINHFFRRTNIVPEKIKYSTAYHENMRQIRYSVMIIYIEPKEEDIC